MFCMKCGNLVTEGKAFCRHCGAKIVETKVPTQDEINLISETQESSNQDIQSLDAKKFKNLIKIWLIGASIANCLFAAASVFLGYVEYEVSQLASEQYEDLALSEVQARRFLIIGCGLAVFRIISIIGDIYIKRKLFDYKKNSLELYVKRNYLIIIRRNNLVLFVMVVASVMEKIIAGIIISILITLFTLLEILISENYLKKRKHLFVN